MSDDPIAETRLHVTVGSTGNPKPARSWQVPPWLRLVGDILILVCLVYLALRPDTIKGKCFLKLPREVQEGRRPIPFSEGSVHLATPDTGDIIVRLNGSGGWAFPNVARFARLRSGIDIYEGGKDRHVHLGFFDILFRGDIIIWVNQESFELDDGSYSAAERQPGSLFEKAAYAEQAPIGSVRQGPLTQRQSRYDSPEATERAVLDIVKSTLGLTTSGGDQIPGASVDPIGRSRLLFELERTFSMSIGSSDFDKFERIGDIVGYINRRREFRSGLDNDIATALQGFGKNEGVYVGKVPDRKLVNAKAAAGVPVGETVFAIVDATLFGSAELALVLGEKGVYYRTSWATSGPEAGFIGYADFARRTFSPGKYEVSLGNGQTFVVAGADISVQRLIELLGKVQAVIRARVPRLLGHE